MRLLVRDLDRGFYHAIRFLEQMFLLTEQGEQRLTDLPPIPNLRVRFDTGVSADWIVRSRPSGTEPLHGPSDLPAVHGRQKSSPGRSDHLARLGAVKRCGIGKHARVATLRCNDP